MSSSSSKKRKKERKEPQESKEERRARRQAKKDAKLAKREQRPEAQVQRTLGYTDQLNPFNDQNLGKKFVWKAKREQLKKSGVDPLEHERERARKREETLAKEVSDVKNRRDEREAEREEWQREQRRMKLERELGTLEEWNEQEEAFHVKQARKRVELRVKAGRARPIDQFYRVLVLSLIHI